tara:strand:+ start:96 stop:851 length:756 start_codon:yes stop_codon:yes gene_type:complete
MKYDIYGVPIKSKGKKAAPNNGVVSVPNPRLDNGIGPAIVPFHTLEQVAQALYIIVVFGLIVAVASIFFFTVTFSHPSAGQGAVVLLFFSFASWVFATPCLQTLNAFLAQPWRSARIGLAIVGLLTTATYTGIQLGFLVAWCADNSQQRVDVPSVDEACDSDYGTILGGVVLGCATFALSLAQIIAEGLLHKYNLKYKEALFKEVKSRGRDDVKEIAARMIIENKDKHARFCKTYDVMYMCYFMPLELQFA